jgi:hypothetical protein
MNLSVYKRFDINSDEKYHPDKYFWPVFSIKNYKQNFHKSELGGWWFDYVKYKKRRKTKQFFTDIPEVQESISNNNKEEQVLRDVIIIK